MDRFLEQVAEILEVDKVTPTDVLSEFDAWDSLSRLSIIALAGESYGATIYADELRSIDTVDNLQKLIESKRQK